MKPKCTKSQCRKSARYYGPIGGYGKLCDEHAILKCVKQRSARARLKKERQNDLGNR